VTGSARERVEFGNATQFLVLDGRSGVAICYHPTRTTRSAAPELRSVTTRIGSFETMGIGAVLFQPVMTTSAGLLNSPGRLVTPCAWAAGNGVIATQRWRSAPAITVRTVLV